MQVAFDDEQCLVGDRHRLSVFGQANASGFIFRALDWNCGLGRAPPSLRRRSMLGMSKPARGVRARTLATFRSEKACAVSVYAELVAGHQIGDCGAALPRYLDDDRGAIALGRRADRDVADVGAGDHAVSREQRHLCVSAGLVDGGGHCPHAVLCGSRLEIGRHRRAPIQAHS